MLQILFRKTTYCVNIWKGKPKDIVNPGVCRQFAVMTQKMMMSVSGYQFSLGLMWKSYLTVPVYCNHSVVHMARRLLPDAEVVINQLVLTTEPSGHTWPIYQDYRWPIKWTRFLCSLRTQIGLTVTNVSCSTAPETDEVEHEDVVAAEEGEYTLRRVKSCTSDM